MQLGCCYPESNMYCKTRVEKKRKSRSSHKTAWHLIRSEEGGEPWHEPEARGGRGLSNPPVKHLYTGDPRGLEGLIYKWYIYWNTTFLAIQKNSNRIGGPPSELGSNLSWVGSGNAPHAW